MAKKTLLLIVSLNILPLFLCRNHKLVLKDEDRRDIEITSFGFLKDGSLQVNITNLGVPKPKYPHTKYPLLGFTLDMAKSFESASYAEDHANSKCVLKPGSVGQNDTVATVYLTFNLTDPLNVTLEVNRWGRTLKNLTIVPMGQGGATSSPPPQASNPAADTPLHEDENILIQTRRRREAGDSEEPISQDGGAAPGQKTAKEQTDGELSVAKTDGKPAAGKTAEEQIAGKTDEEQTAEELTAGKTAEELTAGKTAEELTAGKTAEELTAGKTAEELTAGKTDEELTAAKTDAEQEAAKTEGEQAETNDQQEIESEAGGAGDSNAPDKVGGSSDKPGQSSEVKAAPPAGKPSRLSRLPVTSLDKGDVIYYNTSFIVTINNKSEEGLYSFFFHHCTQDEKSPLLPVNLSVIIVEKNVGPNYLSAGDIPLPTLYTAMSVLFFCSAIYWIYYLCHQSDVFKIHYLMFFLTLIKSLSLMFHAVDYHFIAQDGSPMQAFEILFYITYLTKGALLFGTIVLIGSGWAFIKPILSDNDKTLFWVVIPLQILANVAYIITDTSEEGEAQYYMWKVMFVTVDIICCGAILYPVIWSIRHLQDAAHSDGKAAISLIKLKLFRSYYVLVVCYIYFSRIVVYLLKVTMPFQFMWLDEFFFELATYVFYVLTAYKFRPGSDNPYLQLPSDDEDEDDMEMEEVLTETGMSDGMKRLSGSNGTRAVQREANHSA